MSGIRERVTNAIAESWRSDVDDRFDELDQAAVNRDADAALRAFAPELDRLETAAFLADALRDYQLPEGGDDIVDAIARLCRGEITPEQAMEQTEDE